MSMGMRIQCVSIDVDVNLKPSRTSVMEIFDCVLNTPPSVAFVLKHFSTETKLNKSIIVSVSLH